MFKEKTETLTAEQCRALPTGGQTFHGILRHSNKRIVNGFVFASTLEAERYVELFMLEKAGKIEKLGMQVLFPLRINGVRIGNYKADFTYVERGQFILEEVKRSYISGSEKFRLKVIKACLEMDLGCEFRVWSDGKYIELN